MLQKYTIGVMLINPLTTIVHFVYMKLSACDVIFSNVLGI